MKILPCGLALVVLVGVATEGRGQVGGWRATWENDSSTFQFGLPGSDLNYTNGVRLAFGTDDSETRQSWVVSMARRSPLRLGREDRNVLSSWVVGQHFFTPQVITSYEVDPLDRPYAGLAYGGLQVEMFGPVRADNPTTQHTVVEVFGGVVGAAAGSEALQKLSHVLGQSRDPKGWHHQVAHRPHVGINYTERVRVGNQWLDLTPHVGAQVGTAQSNVYAGGMVRLGFRMSDFASLGLKPTAPSLLHAFPSQERPEKPVERPALELAFMGGVEGRIVGHNVFVTGWGGAETPGPELENLVRDWIIGASARLGDWRFTWTRVVRSPEIAGSDNAYRREHRFGSLSLGFEPSEQELKRGAISCLVECVLPPLFRHLVIEGGLGLADSRGNPESFGARVALGFSPANRRTSLAVERHAVVWGPGPQPTGNGGHEDEFVLNTALTLRAKAFSLGPGRIEARAGAGRGVRRLQAVPPGVGALEGPCPDGSSPEGNPARFCNEDESGWAGLLGIGYWLGKKTSQLTTGLDYTWSTVQLDQNRSFGTLTVGLRWRPGKVEEKTSASAESRNTRPNR